MRKSARGERFHSYSANPQEHARLIFFPSFGRSRLHSSSTHPWSCCLGLYYIFPCGTRRWRCRRTHTTLLVKTGLHSTPTPQKILKFNKQYKKTSSVVQRSGGGGHTDPKYYSGRQVCEVTVCAASLFVLMLFGLRALNADNWALSCSRRHARTHTSTETRTHRNKPMVIESLNKGLWRVYHIKCQPLTR